MLGGKIDPGIYDNLKNFFVVLATASANCPGVMFFSFARWFAVYGSRAGSFGFCFLLGSGDM